MKRLAVFLNGTWNNIDDDTDVRRFHRTIGEPG